MSLSAWLQNLMYRGGNSFNQSPMSLFCFLGGKHQSTLLHLRRRPDGSSDALCTIQSRLLPSSLHQLQRRREAGNEEE